MGGKKAGGGFMGVGGKSGLLNTGLFSSGPQKIKGFEMSDQTRSAESDMIARQNAIASGQAPGYAGQAMGMLNDQASRQAMALAASQRGASNPALAFRQAQMANQQMGLENAQAASIMDQQQRMQADQLIAAQAAAQRGVAFNQATGNMQATLDNQKAQLGALAGLGQAGATAATGGGKGAAHGAIVPGKPVVEGDSEVNDTKPYKLSPGEIVVPRSAAKSEEALKAFVKSLKLEKGDKKSADIGGLMAEIAMLKSKIEGME